MTFFDWLDQLRYTPSYTTVIALLAGGALASLTTLAGVHRTLRHQREESERDREHEQLLKHTEARSAHQDKQRNAIAHLTGVGAEWRVGILQGIDFARSSAYASNPKPLLDARNHVYQMGIRMQTAVSNARILVDNDSMLNSLEELKRANDSLFDEVVKNLTDGILRQPPPDIGWEKEAKAQVDVGMKHIEALSEDARHHLNGEMATKEPSPRH